MDLVICIIRDAQPLNTIAGLCRIEQLLFLIGETQHLEVLPCKLANACGNGDKNLEKHTLEVFSVSNELVLWPKRFTLLY